MPKDVDVEKFEETLSTPPDKSQKVRMYMLTINNYTELEIDKLKEYIYDKIRMRYGCIGYEVAPTTGTEHIHVYLHWVSSKSFTQMKKKFPRADIRICKGSPAQVRAYCLKEKDPRNIEEGDIPASGKRSDIDHIRDVLREGKCSMAEVTQCARSCQAIVVAEKYIQYHEPPRKWKTHVRWFWGESGSGKTYAARQLLSEDHYEVPSNGKWYQGYDGHEECLIDDIRDNFMPFNDFLKFIYDNPFRVEYKGSTRQWKPRKLIITAPFPPEEIWSNREDKYQLIRRIDEIRHFSGRYLEEDVQEPEVETVKSIKTTISSEMKEYFEQK